MRDEKGQKEREKKWEIEGTTKVVGASPIILQSSLAQRLVFFCRREDVKITLMAVRRENLRLDTGAYLFPTVCIRWRRMISSVCSRTATLTKTQIRPTFSSSKIWDKNLNVWIIDELLYLIFMQYWKILNYLIFWLKHCCPASSVSGSGWELLARPLS